jgi:hypothetical protein
MQQLDCIVFMTMHTKLKILQIHCIAINHSSFSFVKYARNISNKSHRSNEILYLMLWLVYLQVYFLRKVTKVDLSFV